MKFSSLNTSDFTDSTIFLDIDGTIVGDGQAAPSEEVVELIKELAKDNDVYICSNGAFARTEELARSLGVSSLPKMRKPFSHRVVTSLEKRDRTVVIGDKYITDGLFAARLGADFVRVERIVLGHERRHTKAINSIDDMFWAIRPYVQIVRPTQWVKNLLVFAPLFFARELFNLHAVSVALLTGIAFSSAASAVYVFNDICDVQRDRAHPKKRHRPLASGALSITKAKWLWVLLFIFTLYILSRVPVVMPVILLYVVVNTVYSVWLKHVAVVDILLVASFYLMRLIAGGEATATTLSPWIILCVFFGALFVILGKRRAEFKREERRKVLDNYSREALDFMLVASAVLTLSSYTLYTVIGHPLPYLLYTTVFVVLAFFRTLNHMYTNPESAESPERMLFTDPWIFGTFILWGLSAFCIFYIG